MKVWLPKVFFQVPLAHRGLHDVEDGRPENSIEAVNAALDAGYGIEIDLQMSRDEQAIVFHDYDLSRLTAQTGGVRERSAKDLSEITLLGGSSGIPLLSQVLDLVAGRVPLLIELKDQDGEMGPKVGPLEKAVATALDGYDGPVAVMSYNPHSVLRMKEYAPRIPRGLVTEAYRAVDWTLPEHVCSRLRDIPDFTRAECSFISHDVKDLSRPRVSELKADGNNILCWTVRSPKQEALARQVAENITFERYLPPLPS